MKRVLPKPLVQDVSRALADWQSRSCTRRMWERDTTLWSGADEGKWLGWLTAVEDHQERIDEFRLVAESVRSGGFAHAVLLGMGGSSMCPEVLRLSFGRIDGAPDLCIIDSTDPGQIRDVESRVDLARTIVIVASKSGSTLEPNILLEYFSERVKAVVGEREAGSRFIAITDPGSSLDRLASERGFRHIVHGVPGIGGRFSALSAFGLAPAAIMEIDVERLLRRATEMVRACSPETPDASNPGVQLGVTLGVLAKGGRDKLTIVASPAIGDLGAWLEQLVGESTGKGGKGIIPVDLEEPGAPDVYGNDRVFVYVRFTPVPDRAQDAAVKALAQAGQPVLRIDIGSTYDLGQEFFRWEIATAAAGAILGINPFDQPDVEASKIATRALTSAYETSGAFPAETPLFSDGTLTFFTDERNAAELNGAVGAARSAAAWLRAHLNRTKDGDYVALLAYIPMNEAHQAALQATRHLVRNARRVATCLGFGPRFLHSTGQIYKGGPNTGVFLQVTCDDAIDLPVPGRAFTFGVAKTAQARGDFQVLAERGRRALRVHLGPDVAAGLRALEAAVRAALERP